MDSANCDFCGGDLEIYNSENVSTEEGLEVHCYGWCPFCRKNYFWIESYLFHAIIDKRQVP